VQDYLVRGLPLVKAVATKAEYRRIAAKVVDRWGKERYAQGGLDRSFRADALEDCGTGHARRLPVAGDLHGVP